MSASTVVSPAGPAPTRQPKGIPVGGQFAASARDEADVALNATDTDPSRAFEATQRDVFTMKYQDIDAKVDAFKAELDQAVADLATDDNWQKYLDTMSRFHRYSFNNQMLIHLQTGGKATRVAGFRAWQQFNRVVTKGEKAIGILAPKMAWIAKKDASGNPVTGADGKPVKEKRCIGFTTASVFDVAQTEGEPLPSVDLELSDEPPTGFVDDMTSAAAAAGYSVEFRAMDSHAAGTAQGWTDPKGKQIVIDSSLSPGSQAATLAHELGHVYAGHCEPGEEGKYHVGDGGCRGRWEVEAESVAYGLTRANGMSSDGSKLSAQYVAGWSRHDKAALRESAETVAKATKAVLASTEFRNVPTE